MSDMVILGPLEFHGAIDARAEYLCVERLADGSLELSSRSRELLGYSGDWFGEPVWPEECNPDLDEDALPLTVGGKSVSGRDGDGVVGHELAPHTDEAVAVFRPGQSQEARVWLEDYGWSRAPNFEAAMEKINIWVSTSRNQRRITRSDDRSEELRSAR
jgi:hypothetical protein